MNNYTSFNPYLTFAPLGLSRNRILYYLRKKYFKTAPIDGAVKLNFLQACKIYCFKRET